MGRYTALLALDERRQAFRPILQVGEYPTQEVKQIWCPGGHANVGGKATSADAMAVMAAEAEEAGLRLENLVAGMPPDSCEESRAKPWRLLPLRDRFVPVERASWRPGAMLAPLAAECLKSGKHPKTAPWRRAKDLPTWEAPSGGDVKVALRPDRE